MDNRLADQQIMIQAPIAFIDLDDTLFQTHRRIVPQADFKMVTTDKAGQPLAYMTPIQQQFAQWLLHSADVIPVTARSVEALSRVDLPFRFGAVCSHGGTILNADQTVNQDWQVHMQETLAADQERMQHLMDTLQQIASQFGSIRTWIVEEQGLGLYVVAKQNTDHEHPQAPIFLPELLHALAPEITQGFYFHLNGNNLAFIPDKVSKAAAVKFLIQQQHLQQRAIIGFGDSLSDVAFLDQCHWWGMPNHSQLNRWVQSNLTEQYKQQGYYGDYK